MHMVFQAIISPRQFECLGAADWSWDKETVAKANGFLYQLKSSSFLLCFKILLHVFSCLRGLTVKLHMQSVDVLFAYRKSILCFQF